MMLLRNLLIGHSLNITVNRVIKRTKNADQSEWNSFEDFTACFHSYRMNMRPGASISLREFYGAGALMSPEVANIKIDVDSEKDYMATSRRRGNWFPPAPGVRKKKVCQDVAKLAVEDMLAGKVLVNSRGAPVDSVLLDIWANDDEGFVVQGMCNKHTNDKKLLTTTY